MSAIRSMDLTVDADGETSWRRWMMMMTMTKLMDKVEAYRKVEETMMIMIKKDS